MKKKEKYNSFQEMKESSASINSENAAVVTERHEKLEGFIRFLRGNHAKSTATNNK
ncbi:hypothetical protein [Runella sp.]|jgi:hypothetical protein|uniref:hypothetical protein n=1 Tax=Runella sp. TaxID=1960881 RepID=UPI00262BAFD7|nr:hypothetical protein [Runella sp.]